jgi:hypothetical protein
MKITLRRSCITFILLLSCGFPFGSASGQQMTFCEKTDAQGNAVNPGLQFTMDSKGSYVYVLVKPAKALEGTEAIIDIFKMNNAGNEIFENSRKVNIQPGWLWFSQRFTFYKPGEYVLYAYDQDGRLLATSKLSMQIASSH